MNITYWMIQNVFAFSVFLNHLGWGHQQVKYCKQGEDSCDAFEYMQEPLAKLTDHTEASRKLVRFTEEEYLTKRVMKVGENIYVAIGYALANSIMIEGETGILIVDGTENANAMSEIMEEFRIISQKPVKAIILTHFHGDHILGTHAILEKEEKLHPGGRIEIIAHELILQEMLSFAATYAIGYKRAHRQFGTLLPKILGSITGSGIGLTLLIGKDEGFHIPIPTMTYKGRKTYHIAGLEFELINLPGETNDQTTIWLPKQKAVLSADNIYKAFPNLYAIRGSPSRDAKQWFTSLDETRKLGAEFLIASHGPPIIGKEEIHDTLVIYRDAIKYVHDQTLRLLNKGHDQNQIVEQIKLPDGLATHPYLQEHYGTVDWSIRGIYTNYLGWFNGNPKDLRPMTESARAARIMRLVADSSTGQRHPAEIMLQHAQTTHMNSYKAYLETGEHDLNEDKWALEIVDMLLESKSLNDNLAHTAKQIKISALRAIGSEEISANGRNYFMAYAMEVEEGIPHVPDSSRNRKNAVKISPVKRVIDIICSGVSGLLCQYQNYTVSFTFTDVKSSYTMRLRNSVCDVFQGIVEPNRIHMHATVGVFKSMILGETEIDDEVAKGKIQFTSGSGELFKRFISCFD